jgi:hypothetical protein
MKGGRVSLLAIVVALKLADPRPAPPDVTGTYVLKGRYTDNKLMVESVGDGEIRVGLHAIEEYDLSQGPHRGRGAHYGQLYGTAKVVGGSARFNPLRTKNCTIELQFEKNRVLLKQEGENLDCGLGFRIAADGAYLRRDRKAPHITYLSDPSEDPFAP